MIFPPYTGVDFDQIEMHQDYLIPKIDLYHLLSQFSIIAYTQQNNQLNDSIPPQAHLR